MYLHIGNNYILSSNEIIMILDKDTCLKSISSRAYFSKYLNSKSIIDISEGSGKIKTYIITRRLGKEIIYSTNIKSTTLAKRFQNRIPGKVD